MLSLEVFEQDETAAVRTNDEPASASGVRFWVVDAIDAQFEAGI